MKEIIGKNSETIKSAHEIFNNYEKVWAEKEYDFWNDIFFKLKDDEFKEFEDGDKDFYNIWYDKEGNAYEENKTLDILENKINKSSYQTSYRGICFKKDNIFIGLEYWNNADNISIWYKGVEKLIDKEFEFDESTNTYWKFCKTQLRFYKNDNLTFEIFDKNEYNKILRSLSKEMNELKNKIMESLKK
jgi:hypothetical protein